MTGRAMRRLAQPVRHAARSRIRVRMVRVCALLPTFLAASRAPLPACFHLCVSGSLACRTLPGSAYIRRWKAGGEGVAVRRTFRDLDAVRASSL